MTLPAQRETVVDSRAIAYRQAGRGEPLVLLHGGMDDSRSWRLQMDALADRFTVLAWDAPGCGASADIPESWRMPDYADAVAAWLGALGVAEAHLLGLSWGSSIAIEVSRRHPRLPRSLVLASAYAGWAGSLSPEETAARLEAALAAADLPPEEAAQALPGLFGGQAPAGLLAELRAVWADNTGARRPSGYRAAVRSMAEADLRDALPRIEAPTLLLYGALDERAPLAVAEALHAQIAGSRLVVVQGAGHLVNVEAPAAFNGHVRDFVLSVTAPTQAGRAQNPA